ncbi:hypothetical protein [Bacteroides heparinolyticus]|uniref:hypothetical protein n=1 Tax=Prevotella heparinolytica TaxID=28113 RepID=UPI00359F1BAA
MKSVEFRYEGILKDLASAIGDTIPYVNAGNTEEQFKDIDICPVKHKGLVSFYDVERQCTCRLAE